MMAGGSWERLQISHRIGVKDESFDFEKRSMRGENKRRRQCLTLLYTKKADGRGPRLEVVREESSSKRLNGDGMGTCIIAL